MEDSQPPREASGRADSERPRLHRGAIDNHMEGSYSLEGFRNHKPAAPPATPLHNRITDLTSQHQRAPKRRADDDDDDDGVGFRFLGQSKKQKTSRSPLRESSQPEFSHLNRFNNQQSNQQSAPRLPKHLLPTDPQLTTVKLDALSTIPKQVHNNHQPDSNNFGPEDRSHLPDHNLKSGYESTYSELTDDEQTGKASTAFACPFRQADKEAKRIPTKHYDRAVWDYREWQGLDDSNVTNSDHEDCNDFIDRFTKMKLKPRNVPGKKFQRLSKEKKQIILHNNNVISAQIVGDVYRKRYKAKKYHNHFEKKKPQAQAGVLFSHPMIVPLFDPNIGIENPNRFNTIHGPGISKHWFSVTVKAAPKEGEDIQYAPVTSYGGRGEPPAHKKEDCFQIIHKEDKLTTTQGDDEEKKVVRFDIDKKVLSKISFVDKTRLSWLNLKTAGPLVTHGRLIPEEFEKMADYLELPENHSFRKEGKRLLAEQKMQQRQVTHGRLGGGSGGGRRRERSPARPRANSRR